MKNSQIYYSVGALLYCPANNQSVANSIINNRFGCQYSMALCLEDTINDNCVREAEQTLLNSLKKIYSAREHKDFFLPKIFIRIRDARHLARIDSLLSEVSELIEGYILPKFSMDNAGPYINTIKDINDKKSKPVFAMPIFESPSIIPLNTRYDILYKLKDELSSIEEHVLNIRVGGNDLCNVFGFRRNSEQSIHDIKPISQIFSDIITVYGTDYVISGPVWEYFNGDNWKSGLEKELAEDMLCGFCGKTVIHPNQIPVVNEAYRVSKKDFLSASAIFNWDKNSSSLVSSDTAKERMNEYKTHFNWALKILNLAEVYGIKEEPCVNTPDFYINRSHRKPMHNAASLTTF